MEQQHYIITASSGIGLETAKILAARGDHVMLVSRTASKLADAAQALNALPGRCDTFVADLTEPEQVEHAVAQCVEQAGRIDGLYNVAGISGSRFGDGPIDRCTEEGWDTVMNANVRSMYLVCRAVLKQMLKQEPDTNGLRGTILNMASVLGISPMPEHFVTHGYAASKGAIIGMTRSMAGYYAPQKVRVNVIAPGLTATPMAGRAVESETIVNAMKKKQPLTDGVIDPVAVAEASAFMLTGASRAVTGDTLVVDGGWCVTG